MKLAPIFSPKFAVASTPAPAVRWTGDSLWVDRGGITVALEGERESSASGGLQGVDKEILSRVLKASLAQPTKP
jgi:hypothetical protein